MKQHRGITLISLLLGIVMVVVGCVGCASETTGKTKVDMVFAPYFNTWLATYAITNDIVTSDEIDINIELSSQYNTQMLAGDFQIGAMSTSTFATATETSNIPFVAISTFVAHAGEEESRGVNILYTREDSTITSPADLVGKTVGIDRMTSSATTAFLAMLEREYGITEDQLTLVIKSHAINIELLRQGELDAAMLGGNVSVAAYIDPTLSILWNLDHTFEQEHGVAFVPSLLVAQADYFEQNKEIAEEVLDMLIESRQYGQEHIEEIVTEYAAEYGGDADLYLNVFHNHSGTAFNLIEGDVMDTIMAIFEMVQERGIISAVPDPEVVFAKW